MSMVEIVNPKEQNEGTEDAYGWRYNGWRGFTTVRLEGIEGNEGVLSQFFPCNVHRRNDPEKAEGDASPSPM